ncbi:MAG: FAD-binding oxidoreductase [Deltaproteobacteria bacterium]|nr:MAG: FAD-binding oxidoreductase [Deltaproteobacteria bacterium]
MLLDELPTLPAVPPPEQVDVAILGAGLPALSLAAALARSGVSVAVIGRGPGLATYASWRAPGLFTHGLPEPAWRLVHALGSARTREVLDLSQRSRTLLEARIPTSPAWHVALNDREATELLQTAETLTALGIEAAHLPGAEARAALGLPTLRSGLSTPLDRAFSPRALAEDLLAELQRRGVSLHGGLQATQLAHLHGDAAVQFRQGPPLRAHAIVLADGHGSRSIEPWLHDKIVPVREAILHVEGRGSPIPAARAQLGYVGWAPQADGSVLIEGCRWATPHMEVFEEDDRDPSAKVVDKLRTFAQQHLSEGRLRGTWARIDAHTCDGLPILGPMPGDPTRIVFVGFQGYAPSLALAAAEGLAEGLLTGTSPLPTWMQPSRFV